MIYLEIITAILCISLDNKDIVKLLKFIFRAESDIY